MSARRARSGRGLPWADLPSGAAAAIEVAEELCGGEQPRAAVALTEAALGVAGEVRAALGIPGASPEVCRRSHDKLVMKRALVAAGVPVARHRLVEEETAAEELAEDLGLPVVLKPRGLSGGRGVRVARDLSELARELSAGELAESFVDGVEMSAETFLSFGRPLLRNRTRYLVPRWANVVPAPLDPATAAELDAVIDEAHRALGVTDGITHAEAFLTPEGVVLGEVAARPPGGRIMDLMGLAYGFDPWEAVLRIALGEEPELPAGPARSAGVWLLHPGPGEVLAVRGLDEARSSPDVVDVRCRVAPGDRVAARLGSGEAVGEVRVVAEDPATCASRLEAAVRHVGFDMAPSGSDG
jgi:biotin carboxylase